MSQTAESPVLVPYQRELSIPGALRDRVAGDPSRVLLERRAGDGWEPVTGREFLDQAGRLARGLIAWGLNPGDVVVILGRTSYEWTLLDVAIWSAGGVPVPVYETSSVEQIAWIVSDSGAVLAFAETAEHASRIAEAGVDGLRETVTFDALAAFADRGADVSEDEVVARTAALTGDDLATVIYTSGTTGRPKGVELTHGNFVYLCRNGVASDLGAMVALPGQRTLLFMPLAHVFARFLQVLCLIDGGVLGHAPTVQNLVADLQSFKPTFLLAVPRVFEKVYNSAAQKAAGGLKGKIFAFATSSAIAYSTALESPAGPSAVVKLKHKIAKALVLKKLTAALGGRMEYAISGGAPLGERLAHFFRGVGVTVLEGYGMTETTAPTTVNRPDHNKVGTVGSPYPGTSLRVTDDGEIQIHGPHVFRGYRNNPEATADAFTEDGWLRTGDLGTLDDGFLRITGRSKDIIVTAGGKNVAPAVLEDRMRAHALISQVAVVGDGRPFIGALVTLDADMLPGWLAARGLPVLTVEQAATDSRIQSEIIEAAREANNAVSQAESIRRVLVLDLDFTETNGLLTPSLKVKRAVVQQELADDIEQLYAKGGRAANVSTSQ